jgi:hypothetical protein
MASNLTVKTDTPSFTPVFNRMPICVYEQDAPTLALNGFKYLVDLYIEGQTFGGIGYYRFEIIPEPVLSYGSVDLHSVCESYVSSTPSDILSIVPFSLGANADGSQSIIKYSYKVGYQWDNAGVITNVPDLITSADKYAWAASMDKIELMDFFAGAPKYLCNIVNGANANFLTDLKENYVRLTDDGWNHILTDTPTDIDRLQVITYDSTGTIIQTVKKAISVAQNLTSSRNYKVATAPASLNAMTGVFVSGAQPIITSAVSYYTVKVTDSSDAVASETLTFYLEDDCRYENRRLWFWNRLGSFDCFNFKLRSQKSSEVKTSGYKMDKYRIVTAGLSYSRSDRENMTTYVEIEDKMIVRSDYLTTHQHNCLRDLITSSEIYLESIDLTGRPYIHPIGSLTQKSWVEKETSIDKLFIMEVELNFSESNFRQRR